MIYAKVLHCSIYKDNQLVLIGNYLYDKNYNQSDILFTDARLSEIVGGYYVKTIHRHFLLLENVRPIVDQKDLRIIKLKKLICTQLK